MEQKNKEQEALPVHLFKGERVVIVEKEEAVEAGVHIIDDYGDSALISEADAIRLHIEGKLTTDELDSGYCGCVEITCDCIVNPEYDEGLICDYVTTEYLATDTAIRELEVLTGPYHRWKSEATEMRERKSEILNDFIPEYFEGLEDDEIEKIKKHNEGVRVQLKELRDKWEKEIIPSYPDPLGVCDPIPFDEL